MPATELAGNLLRASFQSHYNWGPSATARVDPSRCRPSVWESVHYLTLCHLMSFLSIYVIPLSFSPFFGLISARSRRGNDKRNDVGVFFIGKALKRANVDKTIHLCFLDFCFVHPLSMWLSLQFITKHVTKRQTLTAIWFHPLSWKEWIEAVRQCRLFEKVELSELYPFKVDNSHFCNYFWFCNSAWLQCKLLLNEALTEASQR